MTLFNLLIQKSLLLPLCLHTRSGCAKDPTAVLERGSQSFTTESQPPEMTRFSSEQNSIHRTALSWLPMTVSEMTKAIKYKSYL